jgi:hypothetical protein
MKNDMRITYPLWQMGAIVILMVLVLVIGFSSVFTTFENGGFEFAVNFHEGLGVIWGGTLLLFVFYFLLFYWNVVKHNRHFPSNKINIFSWKPQEYMEDDELFQEFTKRATKKVYSYFVWSIPFLAGLSIGFRVGTTGMVVGLLFLSLGQYLIYYKEIRKYVGADE